MNLKKQNAWLVAGLLLLGSLCTQAVAQVKPLAYMQDSRGVVVKNSTGLCWRTGYWTPAQATEECDPDLVKKPTVAEAPTPVPAPAVKPEQRKITLAADVLFDFDKYALKPEGKTKLDDVVTQMKDMNLEVIIAIGHTDSIGTDAYNQKLSVRRAESVKSYLVSKGIDANRVYTEGKGEKQPIADNKSRDGRQKNRRVEIEVVGTSTK
ncbi:MAG TPA: OmpA family protein [Burkholderiales bacterium]|nr:OmpA family protein [Burkholderiales bacterium]